jgi:hypothetical protein
MRLSGTALPARRPWSAVMTCIDLASLIRDARPSALNPANTTLCVAPSRAHASIA